MKIFKLCSLFVLATLTIGLVQQKNENIPLTEQELSDIFPDSNFRNVIDNYFTNEYITLSKIKSLDGEFYASNENIEDLSGISTLENIDTFILWNNNIETLPKEVLNLKNTTYINIENNYITDNTLINSLKESNVKVDHDLNFIPQEESQYKLCTNNAKIYVIKNEKINIRSLLYKSINNYTNYWEPSKELSKSCKLYIDTSSPSTTSIYNDSYVSFSKEGTYYITVSLDKNQHAPSTVIIEAIVK